MLTTHFSGLFHLHFAHWNTEKKRQSNELTLRQNHLVPCQKLAKTQEIMKDMRLHPLVAHPLILMLAVKEAKKKQLQVNW